MVSYIESNLGLDLILLVILWKKKAGTEQFFHLTMHHLAKKVCGMFQRTCLDIFTLLPCP